MVTDCVLLASISTALNCLDSSISNPLEDDHIEAYGEVDYSGAGLHFCSSLIYSQTLIPPANNIT